MDQSNIKSVCRFCLINKTKGYGSRSYAIDEIIQNHYENFTSSKLITTASRPKLICLDCKSKLEASHSFKKMILESQSRLDQLLPHENLETCLITVKQEIAFVDESAFVIKVEPEYHDEQQVVKFTLNDDEKTSIIVSASKINKKRKPHEEKIQRKSSRNGNNKSFDGNSPELDSTTEGLPKKKGRPRKPILSKIEKSLDTDSFLQIQKTETLQPKEASRESTFFDGFDDGDDNYISDDDFKPTEDFFEDEPPKEEVSAKPEIYATCSICPKKKKVQFLDEDDRKIHNEMVHEDVENPFEGPFKCKSCSKVIASEIKARRHVRQFHLFKNEKLCTTCGKTFYDRRAFYCHVDKNHGIRNVTCPIENCGKMFNGKMNLGKHLKTHLPDGKRKIYICDRCGSKYINKDNIKPHMMKCDGRTFKDHTLIKPRRKLNKLKCYSNLGI